MEGQFKTLIAAGPANLVSRSMIPYQVLIYILRRTETLAGVRSLLSKRFNTAERLQKFQEQLDHMVANLAAFQFLTRSEDGEHVTLNDTIGELTVFHSVDPLYGAFACKLLAHANFEEKLQALESVLSVQPSIERLVRPPDSLAPGPLQKQVLEPSLIQAGAALLSEQGAIVGVDDEDVMEDYWAGPMEKRPLTFVEMLKALFDTKLATPEIVPVRPIWIAGGVFEFNGEFFKYVRSRDLLKNEGLVLRHLLRLVILAGEFHVRSGNDPDYERISELATRASQQVDPRYTDRFLEAEHERKRMLPV